LGAGLKLPGWRRKKPQRLAGVSSVQNIRDGDSVKPSGMFEADIIKQSTRSDTLEKTSLIP